MLVSIPVFIFFAGLARIIATATTIVPPCSKMNAGRSHQLARC
jgi:hypothetical protein